ncbi:hypothetical protein [Kitasatospora sp. NRRL B-11411]|uniref:hypothetical protein n=1 Tax=Kitasatospora sp. NRRL B-11411 TaxID=1463822 RepID=UPI0012FF2B3E|nr:hypothetical protein [Kitasatospora sp. NRRL B-11411]
MTASQLSAASQLAPTETSTAEQNKDVVRRLYEAVLRVPGGPNFATAGEPADEQEVELNWGHPDSGVHRGAAIGPAATGYTG